MTTPHTVRVRRCDLEAVGLPVASGGPDEYRVVASRDALGTVQVLNVEELEHLAPEIRDASIALVRVVMDGSNARGTWVSSLVAREQVAWVAMSRTNHNQRRARSC